MTDNCFDVKVDGKPDGRVERLGLGHAWVWTRAVGEKEVFDCGCTISHVLSYAAVRLNCSPQAIDMRPCR